MSKILVVDDEAIITMQLEEQLRDMGYTVVGVAASGEEAVEKARQYVPDLILMDIVMPGRRMNGIEAARAIIDELGIPVVFVTSYADDKIIEMAKQVQPYGYIVKPFNELEIKAAIEVALFRKSAELERMEMADTARKGAPDGTPPVAAAMQETAYVKTPEIKTVFFQDLFSDILLFLYVDPSVRDPVFKFAIEEGIKKGGRFFFAYHVSPLQKSFVQEIKDGKLFIRKIKKGELYLLPRILEKCAGTPSPAGTAESLQILLDFYDAEDFADIIAVKRWILAKRRDGFPLTGIIAINMAGLDHHHIRQLSEGIAKVFLSTGEDTTVSFVYPAIPAESLAVVPRTSVESVIRKQLEPVVISMLDKPVSGYDIVQKIHSRYKVRIPQARVYALLNELQQKGYLETKVSGKSKLYVPTEAGKKAMQQQLKEFRYIFQHILEDGLSAPDKKE